MKHADSPDTLKILRTLVNRMESAAGPEVSPTVPEAITAFLDAKAKTIKPISHRNYARHLINFQKVFGTARIGDVSEAAIAEDAASRGWSDTNIVNYLATVEACLKHSGRIIHFLKPGRESAGADSIIPEPVYRRVLRESTGDFHQIIRFLWATGCRPGEASNLRAEQVDFSAGIVRLKEHKTRGKTGRARLIYLGPQAAEVLDEQIARYSTGYLFRGVKGKPYSIHAIVHRFVRLSAKVGHAVCGYGFRHTFATRTLASGMPDAHVAALLGHTNTTMVHKHYSHVSQDGRLLRGAAAAAEAT